MTPVDAAALRAAFVAGYGFALDDFQIRALDAIDAGASVLVAAPTSSGKTVVAEYAVARAIQEGTRAFYTAPIKALSNQKYADLVRRHGARNVGLLTGDNSINGDAPVVVMTTEVLRNMIYASSDALDHLRYVVLDEVHYLQDAYRGPVWEEVIIHTPQTARLVCLSATVSNADELADWMTTVRGPTATVIEERRPVELQNLYLIGDRTSDRLHLLPTLVDGRPNPEAARLDGEATRARFPTRGRGRRKLYTPRRVEVVELLEHEGMLPAIYFIFSRAACSDAAAACLDAGLRLTTAGERDRIREIVGARLRGIDDADLAVLGYARWMGGLEAGIAPHHAGLVPPFKEAVEACFVEGLVKVVFATETLALGINMPARSVVIEKLTKFTGERHQFLTPGEYTQLTGRAGRRGIDTVGHALVLWSPFLPFDQVAGLASSRTFRLTSAFRPTYNMAANLVRTYPRDQAHHLLNLSFGQYQADRDVVRLEARLERRREVLAALTESAHSPYGDIDEFRRTHPRRERRPDGPSREEVLASLARLKPGDVIMLQAGKHAGRAAVLTVAQRRGGGVRLRVITPGRRLASLSEPDFEAVVQPVGAIELPTPFAPNRQSYQREVGRLLERARLHPEHVAPAPSRVVDSLADGDPILRDPQLDERLRAAAQAERVAREVRELEERIGGRVGSLARRFDRVVRILEMWGYLDDWKLTQSGERLASLFHESDLLVAEAIGQGLLDDLDPAALAGIVSCFTYEHRSPEPPPPPWFPSNKVRDRWRAVAALAAELNAIEDEAGLDLTRAPDPTFVALAHAWAAGEPLDEVLEDEELSGGDFVRNIKQLIDLLGQVADVTFGETATAAREAANRLFRGVVAASSTVAGA
ncbi:MAG TPA: DEAD/DEAH box helicase [Acidimicrobiales bacterium]|nr:DEAD/DEAH box helicase [Acidimicrobiales bacterium]